MILPLILGIVYGPSLVRCMILPTSQNLNFRPGSPDGKNDCNLACPSTIDYHCGTDGITYDNPCLLLNANCKNPDIKLGYKGQCSPDKPIPVSSCPRTWTCLGQYQPVCGTNGQTYDNNCYLVIANCRDTSIAFSHLGPCEGNPVECKRFCSHIPTSSVCASDNIIYRNLCELRNAICTNANLFQVPCPTPPQPRCADVCPLTYDPKCGSDGKSYINKCHMDLITCRNPSITLAYDGICRDSTPKITTGCTRCSGNEPEDYVCGSDGTSYRSACAFNNALCNQPCPHTLKLEHSGRCTCDETCTFDQIDPVCGSDGVTYETACAFRVASCQNPLIRLTSTRACTVLVASPAALPNIQ